MFRFKQFNVDQTGCAMKINTDGVLLGALSEANNPQSILDIGTGTGVIALMLAQRFERAKIDAVEIDETAAATAGSNFEGSPFAGRLNVFPIGFETFLGQSDRQYELIVSNPPFHINSLESPGAKTNLAKHADENFFERLLGGIAKHLNEDGKCYLILPLQTAVLVKVIMLKFGLNLEKLIRILSYPDSAPHREILVLSLDNTREADGQFVIYKEPKVYSNEYQDALSPFFTIF
jgi:tRNA1Val (adenine37-N6)-methyltransferase